MKKWVSLILSAMLLVCLGTASLAETGLKMDPSGQETEKGDLNSRRNISPEDALKSFDADNGIYWAQIPDADNILNGGYFTAQLYMTDLYPSSEITRLKAGDLVHVHGQTLTVKSMVSHEEGELELYPVEDFDGYIVFRSYDDTHHYVIVNDCTVVSYVSPLKVMMPLPNDFAYAYAAEEDVSLYDADDFVSLVTGENAPELTQYNTSIVIHDGLVKGIVHSDYPEGLGD